MNAQPCFNSRAADMYAAEQARADREAAARELAIEDMLGTAKCWDDFSQDTGILPSSIMSVIASEGLPSRDGSRTDQRHTDKLVVRIDAIKAKFETWAKSRSLGGFNSPLDRWMEAE